jgi:ABC-type branched-subunit amino acid transport system substrate-binding protein
VRPALSRSSRLAVALSSAGVLLLTASGCAARFDRPPASTEAVDQGGGLPVDQGGLPVVPSQQPGQTTTGSTGTTGATTGVQQGPSTTGGTTGGTTGSTTGTSGTTGGSTTGGTGSVPAGDTTGVTKTDILIGLIVPKTGAAPVPPTIDAQAQNYFDYVNKKGGLFGRKLTVKVYDTNSTEAGARSAVQSAIGDKIFAAVTLDRLSVEAALITALHNAHIPHLVAQAPPSTPIPDDAFYIGMNQLHHGPQIADYMSHTLHKTKVGVITENDPGLTAPKNAFKKEAQSLGMSVFEKSVDPSANQYFNEVSALCSSKAETTWLYMAPNVAINIAVEYKNQCPGQTMVWVGNNISWGFNLVISPAAGALDGAKVFSPWGGLHDPRYATFNAEDDQGQTDRDKDIGLAAWGFGQVVAAAIKNAGPDLGRNSFRVAMQNLRTGTTDIVTGAAMCWTPLDFTGGKRYGSGDRSIVMTVQGSGSTAIWATESDYKSRF